MRMKTLEQKTPTLKTLANEVSLLRSFFIGTKGRDSEGDYRPDFVENMLRVSAHTTVHREFLGAGEFLRRTRHAVS